MATRVDGALYYVHQDLLGSTVAVSDAAGQAVGRVQYDPYGEVLANTLPVTLTERLFTGQRFDSSSGLYYYNARYYDPRLGRFIQPDTLVPAPLNPQAWNRFSYVYNNPTSYIDPSGHGVPVILLIAAVGFLAGEIYAGTQGYTPRDVEFWYYSGGGAVAATSLYFLVADVAIVAGLGLQQAGLWTGSTTAFGWGLTITSAGAGMYAWAFQPLDFGRWGRLRAAARYFKPSIGAYGIEPISGRTWRMRQLLLEQMAKEMGYDPRLVKYVHELQGGYGGRVDVKTGVISIDAYAFDPHFLRAQQLSGPREILAHEIGHVRLYRKGLDWAIEFAASVEGSQLKGLTKHQRQNLLEEALRRAQELSW